MRRYFAILMLALVAGALPALADTLDINVNFSSTNTQLTGAFDVKFNTSDFSVISSTGSYTIDLGEGAAGTFTGADLTDAYVFPGPEVLFAFADDTLNTSSGILLDLSTITGPGTYTVPVCGNVQTTACSGSYPFASGFAQGESFTLADGNQTADVTITEFASTPEPSSLALLGTGVLGIGGVLRRRMVRA